MADSIDKAAVRCMLRDVIGIHPETVETYMDPLSLVPNPLERRLAKAAWDGACELVKRELDTREMAECPVCMTEACVEQPCPVCGCWMRDSELDAREEN